MKLNLGREIMKVTAKLADTLAKRMRPSGATWEELRDDLDIRCGSELDVVQLDMLTDMVEKRLNKKAA